MNNTITKEISLQQAALQRITLLRDHLVADESDKEYIHRIRVDIKYLRAWLRLTRIDTETKNWKEMDRSLSKESKYLGQVRDIQAMISTIKALSKPTSSKKEKAVLKLLIEKFNERPATAINLVESKTRMSSLLDQFQLDYISVDSIDSIHVKLDLSFKKARTSGKKVFSNKYSDEELHRFRKWVKHLYYQLMYMGSILATKDEREIKMLGKELGDAHDLLVLKKTLPDMTDQNDLKILTKLINKEVNKTVATTKKRFERLSSLSLHKLSTKTIKL